MPLTLETLPLQYKKRDLKPVMSAKTINYHYEHLAKNYATNYNAGKGDPAFNKAGNFLHNIFFAQFNKPVAVPNDPTGRIAEFIAEHFGSFTTFKERFKTEAMKIQGSGWIYLSTDGSIKVIPNHKIRRDILVLVDWWEHAWALDYKSDKARYLDNIWLIMNWKSMNEKREFK